MAAKKKDELKDRIVKLIETIRDNMTRCNIGQVIGPLYESGYRHGVDDVIKMLNETLDDYAGKSKSE